MIQAKIVGSVAVESPMRRYYCWHAKAGLNVLYVEDVATKVRYSVESDLESFHLMREWTDGQWDAWLEVAIRKRLR